jgi:hypothetical protein
MIELRENQRLPQLFLTARFAMQAQGLEWGDGYRPLGRQALQEIIEDKMAAAVARYLEALDVSRMAECSAMPKTRVTW